MALLTALTLEWAKTGNLCFAAMVACCCLKAGVNVRYQIGRKLVGDRTAKAKL